MAENPTKPDDDDVGDPGEIPQGPTEELVAYLDGELDAKAAEAMATKLTLDAKLRAEADSLQRAWDILDVLPKPRPSSSFTTKTVSQVIPLPSGTQLTLPMTSASSGARTTMTAAVAAPPRVGIGFWVAALLIIVAASGAGYVGHALLAPVKAERETDALMIDDLSLLKNARLFHNVDDMEYLKQLDSPELFGDDD